MNPQAPISLTYSTPRVRPRRSKLAIAALAASILSLSGCFYGDAPAQWLAKHSDLVIDNILIMSLMLPGCAAAAVSGLALIRIHLSHGRRYGVAMSVIALLIDALSVAGGYVLAQGIMANSC